MAFSPEHALAWAEMPVTDMERSVQFYNMVFDFDMEIVDAGPNLLAMFPNKDAAGICGHLYPGTPAKDGQGPTVHFVVPDDLVATMDRCVNAGGKVLSDVIAIPAGRFAYAQDIDGNSLGLFELKK